MKTKNEKTTIRTTEPNLRADDRAYLAKRDANLQAKYDHYVKGSVRRHETETKLEAEIKCPCGAKRTVWTSDIFQVKVCWDCKKASNKAKAEAREAKKGKKDKN